MFQPAESACPVQSDAADPDPLETREWLESLESVVRRAGKERGQFLMKELEVYAQQLGIAPPVTPYSSYRNTISLDAQPVHPQQGRSLLGESDLGRSGCNRRCDPQSR